MIRFLKDVKQTGLYWQFGWMTGKRNKKLVFDSVALGFFSIWIENQLDFTDWRDKYSLEWHWND